MESSMPQKEIERVRKWRKAIFFAAGLIIIFGVGLISNIWDNLSSQLASDAYASAVSASSEGRGPKPGEMGE